MQLVQAPSLDVIHNFMHRLWITLYRGFRDIIPLKVRIFPAINRYVKL